MSDDERPLIEPDGNRDGPAGATEGPAPIVITITLTQTPQGTMMRVDHPPTIFVDTIIDACSRAARFYERRALLMEMAEASARAAQQARILNKTLGRS